MVKELAVVIKIYSNGAIKEDGWDYPIEELDYLLKEHDGESFVLIDGRLCEMKGANNND